MLYIVICFLMQFFLKFWEAGSSPELVFNTRALCGQIRKDRLSVVFTEEWVSFQAE